MCERYFIYLMSGIYLLTGQRWRSGPAPGSAFLPVGTGETGEADAHGSAAAACRVTRAGHDVAGGLPAAHSREPGTRTR
jgi:hypothetical protein